MMGETLTLDSCVSMALSNNKEMRMAQLQAEQYRHTEKSYLANYFPNISASAIDLWSTGKGNYKMDIASMIPASITQGVSEFGQAIAQDLVQAGIFSAQEVAQIQQNLHAAYENLEPSIDYKIGNIFNAGISVEQPIYMGGKITAAYHMGKLGHKMADMNVQLTEDQVIVETHEAYALLLKASELTQVAERYDSLLSQLLHDVESAERHGLRGHNDVLKVQVKKSEAELQLLQARNGRRLAQMNLSQCIGLPLGTDIEVQEVSDEASAELTPHSNTVEGRPEYSILDMKSQMAAEKVKLERSEFLPQLGVMATLGYTHGLQVMDSYLFHKPSFSVMASLKIPIYHANEAHHKVKAARLEHERAMLEQENLVEKMNLEMQQAANQLDESILEVQLTRKGLEQAEDNLRSSRKSYDVGLESTSDMLEAQTLWQQAYAKKVIAECQLLVNVAKYRKTVGKL